MCAVLSPIAELTALITAASAADPDPDPEPRTLIRTPAISAAAATSAPPTTARRLELGHEVSVALGERDARAEV